MESQKKIAGRFSIDDFTIGKKLGEGKFGVVTVCKHRRTGMVAALKKIPKSMIKSHMMVDQLALEIRLQSCLTHKNILGVYGFFDDAAHLYLVLEYMPQGTLYSKMKKTKILSEEDTGKIIKQIAEGVKYLHEQDIAHRDIKPENIVISNVRPSRLRTFISCAILGGPRCATSDARPTAGRSTSPRRRYWRGRSMT